MIAIEKTKRLIIRRFNLDDYSDLIALSRDKMASKYSIYDHQFPVDDEGIKDMLHFFISEDAWWAIELIDKKLMIGLIATNSTKSKNTIDLGYTIRSDYQNQNYAYEACNAVMIHYKHHYNISKFIANTAECNIPSIKLLRKLGFRKIGTSQATFLNDENRNPITFLCGTYECDI